MMTDPRPRANPERKDLSGMSRRTHLRMTAWPAGHRVPSPHSTMRTTFAVASRLRTVCLCVLVAAGSASASTPFVIADFDGDGHVDRADVNGPDPSAVRVWLSATGHTSVLRSAAPVLEMAARDLDGDRRAELIVSSASRGLHIWKKRRNGFRSVHPKPVAAGVLSTPSRHRVDDAPADSSDAISPPAPCPLALARAAKSRAPAVTAGCLSTWLVPTTLSSGLLVPAGPRPPPRQH